jgi:hypothetical protein
MICFYFSKFNNKKNLQKQKNWSNLLKTREIIKGKYTLIKI